jgi:parallel beta-helix repeat protein
MKKVIGISALCIVGLFLLLQSSGEAQTAVTVRCSAGQLIQPVIDASGPDTTITVHGVCNENITIDSTKSNITLIGYVPTVTINGATTSATILIEGRGIVIQGLNVTGGEYGIQVKYGGTATINGTTIQGALLDGVVVSMGSSLDLLNNTIQNNSRYGIDVADNSVTRIGFVSSTDTVAQPNTIQNNANDGIIISRSSSARIVGNTIVNNTGDGIGVIRESHADISDNVINGNGNDGIDVVDNSGVNLGNTSGSTIFDLPNSTTVNNGVYGISCTVGGYADDLLGTLNGATAATNFTNGCINNL